MVILFNILFQVTDAISFLLLSAIGLAVIFGMMKIINLISTELPLLIIMEILVTTPK